MTGKNKFANNIKKTFGQLGTAMKDACKFVFSKRGIAVLAGCAVLSSVLGPEVFLAVTEVAATAVVAGALAYSAHGLYKEYKSNLTQELNKIKNENKAKPNFHFKPENVKSAQKRAFKKLWELKKTGTDKETPQTAIRGQSIVKPGGYGKSKENLDR